MKIHEYQAKELFAQYGIPVCEQKLIENPDETEQAVREFGREEAVIKAQVHAGGRGKAGGVKIARGREQIVSSAKEMFGKPLVTHQSGPAGIPVRKVLLTELIGIRQEIYLSIAPDYAAGNLTIIASDAGGTEIETLAAKHPEKIVKIPVSLQTGLLPYHGLETALRIGLPPEYRSEFIRILSQMYKLFTEKSCSLIEINPLVITTDGKLNALDAKINFDDNALMLHPDIAALRDTAEENPEEAEAAAAGLSYVALDGNIGCLVNGAGLAMATMDLIKSLGGEPANFLDVGGSASVEKVSKAFSILLRSPKVRAVMVNIFGGIMRCDVIASAIIEAAKTTGISVPIIVRLEGTNADLGKQILRDSEIALIPAHSFRDAAEKAVAAAEGGNL